MGESRQKKEARQNEMRLANENFQIELQRNQLQRDIYNQISPFAGQAMGIGQAALQGQLPASFWAPQRAQIAEAYQGANQNLADFLGKTGQGFTGIAAGPAANLQAQQANAVFGAYNQGLNNAINLGFQGGNVLQGQQGIFNPSPFGGLASGAYNNILQAPSSSFGSALLGGVTGGIGGGLGRLI